MQIQRTTKVLITEVCLDRKSGGTISEEKNFDCNDDNQIQPRSQNQTSHGKNNIY